MNLPAIIIANSFGLALLISLLVSNILTHQRRNYDDKLFMVLILIFMAANIIEPLTFISDGRPGAFFRFINLWGTVYLYTANIVSGLVWCMYVDFKLYKDMDHLKRNLPLYSIFPTMGAIALIVNLIHPYLFMVDENNVFVRLKWCWIMYAMIFMAVGIAIWIYYNYRRIHGKVSFFPVWIFMIPVIAGSLVQGFIYGISTAWPAAAIGVSALHISLQNQKSFIDPLTGLYNRLFLEHTLAVAGGMKYYGIMLDINYFKRINDEYGHSTGDRALNKAAELLSHAVTTKGSVFRYAGDEYVIMLETDSESDVIETERRIRESAEKFSAESTEPYTISFSMGHAKLEKNDTEDEFLRKIDKAMYVDKKKMHEEAGR